jgi:hypothetical protein
MATSPEEDRALAQVQLNSAGEDALAGDKEDIKRNQVEFKGEKFGVADEIGAIPMLMWAAASDTDTEDPAGLAAIWVMLEDCIHEDDWKRLVKHGLKTKAQGDELMELINRAMELITGNPTEEDNGSSGGASKTSARSTAGTSRTRTRA